MRRRRWETVTFAFDDRGRILHESTNGLTSTSRRDMLDIARLCTWTWGLSRNAVTRVREAAR